jgi:hypothetical protein
MPGQTDFNNSLHTLNPRAENVVAWNRVKSWLDAQAGYAMIDLEELNENEYGLLFP